MLQAWIEKVIVIKGVLVVSAKYRPHLCQWVLAHWARSNYAFRESWLDCKK